MNDNDLEQTNLNTIDALSHISEEINSLQEIDALLKKILGIAIQTLDAERGFILLTDKGREYKIKTAQNIHNDIAMDLTNISNSVVNQALEVADPIVSLDVQRDDRFKGSDSILIKSIKSVASVPLTIKNRVIGVIYLDSKHHKSKFNESSIPFLKAFANQAAIAIENSKLYESLRDENRKLRKEIQRSNRFENIIGSSTAINKVFDIMESIVDSDVTVLIEGSSGTGKELVARALHYNSRRKDKAFMALFCGALPESLLESELFGHKKGAFTGAISDKKGLFEEADGGSFFLDEVSELSPKIQVQLLRVLQEGEIKRVGENHFRNINVRLLAATNKNLYDLVKEGSFREDLYYRLNVIKIEMPPLRERGNDIALLANHFLDKYATINRKDIHGFSRDAMEQLYQHQWPGNVRELENTVERAVILCKKRIIDASDMQIPRGEIKLPVGMKLKDFEEQLVKRTLENNNNNITETARTLGVSRRWLHYRLKEWNDENN